MKSKNEVLTAELVVNSISDIDVQNYIDGLREVTEIYLYFCAKEGGDPDFGYNALTNATELLKQVQEYNTQSGKLLKMAVGM